MISLTLLAEVVGDELLQGEGRFLLLVKPQFEVDRKVASKGRGVVRDPAEWAGALESVVAAYRARGARIAAVVPSAMRGASGNQEFFVLGSFGGEGPAATDEEIAEMVAGAVERAAGGLL
ncbi:MAG: hypothetical protein M0Z88_08425 [Actinomycetota bacterium]|nr:hypothetical protein [Actinomycetota bacterium]